MSFSARVKSEIIEKGISSFEEKSAFLSGFIRATGSIIKKDDEYGFEFSVESYSTAEYVLYLMRSAFGYEPKDEPLVSQRITVECVGGDAVELLERLSIVRFDGEEFSLNVSLDEFASDRSRKAFIKGVFVGSGNITVPQKRDSGKNVSTGYHLEFVFFGYEQALEFTSFLAKSDVFTKLISRKENYVIYVKSSEEIKDFLAYVGAPKCALELTEIMLEKEITAKANRRANCDIANVTKQADASYKMVSVIEEIEKTVGLESLPLALMQTAAARREYPDDTLQELADRLNITKSCLNHRLRKLTEIEKNLR